MRKLIIAVLTALCLASCAPRSAEPYFFIQMTDPQMGFREKGIEQSVRYLQETVDAINRLHPAFVLVTGDMLNNWNNQQQWEAYDRLMSTIDKDIPVYTIPGNHDYRPLKEADSVEKYFERWDYDRVVFSYGGDLYLGFNTNVIKDNQVTEEAEQYDWMVAQLKKYARKARHVILFGHCPIIKEAVDEKEDYFNFQEPYRSKYLQLCKDYGVEMALYGHLHKTRTVLHDGTRHITCTASGAALGDGMSGAFNIVTVRPDTLEFNIVRTTEAVNPLK